MTTKYLQYLGLAGVVFGTVASMKAIPGVSEVASVVIIGISASLHLIVGNVSDYLRSQGVHTPPAPPSS